MHLEAQIIDGQSVFTQGVMSRGCFPVDQKFNGLWQMSFPTVYDDVTLSLSNRRKYRGPLTLASDRLCTVPTVYAVTVDRLRAISAKNYHIYYVWAPFSRPANCKDLVLVHLACAAVLVHSLRELNDAFCFSVYF